MPETSPTPASSSAHAISAPRVDHTKFSFPNDIGIFVGRALSVSDKNDILCCWTPPSSYSFPLLQFGQQRRCFQRQWLDDFKWLAYSDGLEGAFCKWCVGFASQTVTRSAQPPGALVTAPHSNHKKAKEYYVKHQNCEYHKLASTLFLNFVRTQRKPETDIQNILATKRLETINENRNRMKHIIRCVEFCCRQELPLRGHRVAGSFNLSEPDHNEGVFKAALRLRIECADQKNDRFS